MHTFKIGDMVTPMNQTPLDSQSPPYWITFMDSLIGVVGIVVPPDQLTSTGKTFPNDTHVEFYVRGKKYVYAYKST